MTTEITNPFVEAMIQQRMESGGYSNLEELIREVLLADGKARTGAALVEAMRACPYPEVEIAPKRIASPVVRDANL